MRELVDVDQAGARDDVLYSGAAVDTNQLAQQLNFTRRTRREVRVPSLRGAWYESPVHMQQERFAEAGARSDHRRVPFLVRDAALEHLQLVGFEHGDAIRQRFEIVQDVRALEPQPLRYRRAVDAPWHVRQMRDLIGHRPGDAEARRLDVPRLDGARLEKRLDHRLEARMIERGKFSNVDRRRAIGPGLKKSKQRLRSTDVSRQQHG